MNVSQPQLPVLRKPCYRATMLDWMNLSDSYYTDIIFGGAGCVSVLVGLAASFAVGSLVPLVAMLTLFTVVGLLMAVLMLVTSGRKFQWLQSNHRLGCHFTPSGSWVTRKVTSWVHNCPHC